MTGAPATGPGGDLPALPDGWTVLRTWGPLSFTTHALLRRPDGTEVEWSSRRHRKGLGLRRPDGHRLRAVEGRWGGRPQASSWWMGGLFAFGSVCFALGSVPLFFDHVDSSVVAATFFVGSLAFTAAAAVQYHEAARAPEGVLPDSARPGLRHLLRWKPHRLDWWASAVQLVGTVLFNVSTFAATRTDLDAEQVRRLVWAPDVYGSVCFLVASGMAWSEVNRGVRPRPDGSVGWRIGLVNLVGSIAFGVSAVAARIVTTTGEPANITLVNLGTFVGAVGFLVGAVLLPVESAADGDATPPPSSRTGDDAPHGRA